MLEDNQVKSGGAGVLGLLGALFVALKLIGVEPVAHWSWWLVTSPFWGGFAFVAATIAVMLVIWGLVLVLCSIWEAIAGRA